MSDGWIYCEHCGKKLLRRKPNGIFVLKFGRGNDGESVIEVEIHGSIKIRCFRKECRQYNIINYFPS